MLPPHSFSPSVLFLFCVFLFASARRWRNGVSLQKCFRALLSASHEAYEWHRRSFGCVCVCLAQKRMGENARGVGRPRGKVSVTTQYIKPFSHNRIMIPTNRMIFWRIGILELFDVIYWLVDFFFFFSFLIHRSFIHRFFFLSLQANHRMQIQFSARVVNSVVATVHAFTSVSCAMESPIVRTDPTKIQRNVKY